MRRRDLLTLIGGSMAGPVFAHAQQLSSPLRIGFLRTAGPNEREFDAFRGGLAERGYVEGRSVSIEQRYAGGVYERLNGLAKELVESNVHILVVDGTAAAQSARAATASIPIVFTLAADPVADGLVGSLARPDANLTGLTISVGYELVAKRVELFKQIKPNLGLLAILGNGAHPGFRQYHGEVEKAASSLGLSVRSFVVRNPSDLPAAFAAMGAAGPGGLITLNDPMLYTERKSIAALAREYRLASMHPESGFAEEGGLVSYGPSLPDLFRRAASFVERILKGARPADLPVEQPYKFELVLNLRTATALGLTIQESILARADKVIN